MGPDLLLCHSENPKCLGGKCGLGRFENEFSGPLSWPEFTTALAAKSDGPSLISRTLKVGGEN